MLKLAALHAIAAGGSQAHAVTDNHCTVLLASAVVLGVLHISQILSGIVPWHACSQF